MVHFAELIPITAVQQVSLHEEPQPWKLVSYSSDDSRLPSPMYTILLTKQPRSWLLQLLSFSVLLHALPEACGNEMKTLKRSVTFFLDGDQNGNKTE